MKTIKKTAMLLVTLLLLAVCLTACQTTYAVTYKGDGNGGPYPLRRQREKGLSRRR